MILASQSTAAIAVSVVAILLSIANVAWTIGWSVWLDRQLKKANEPPYDWDTEVIDPVLPCPVATFHQAHPWVGRNEPHTTYHCPGKFPAEA